MADSIIDRRTNAYALDPDANRGFKTAVNNGQVRLALEYLLIVVHKQNELISQLEERLQAVEEKPSTDEAPRRSGRRPRDDEHTPTPETPPPSARSMSSGPVKEEPPKEVVAS